MHSGPYKTVGELVDALQQLDRDLPLHCRDQRGSSTHGVSLDIRTLATHQTDDTFIGDITDNHWDGHRWLNPFKALCIRLKR